VVLLEVMTAAQEQALALRTCAEFKQMCLRRASDCIRAANDVQALVVQHGGNAENSGTAAGAVHRSWVSVRDVVRHQLPCDP